MIDGFAALPTPLLVRYRRDRDVRRNETGERMDVSFSHADVKP